jgi:putative flavoprotein involved in K+ transport
VITGVSVDRVRRDGDRYVVRAGAHRFEADNVVIASGTFQEPEVPAFASELDPAITQMHSSEYRNPSQLQAGPALVVGAAHSGSDVALDVSANHQTTLAGKINGELPFQFDSPVARVVLPVLWFVANHVLTMRTPLGRKGRHHVRAHGGPLLRVKRADLDAAGVHRTEARVVGVRDGLPLLDDGRMLDVANVIWCTGFGKDVSWIDGVVTGADGWPEQKRGAVESSPGLYFVGLPFLDSFASMLVGGAGRDAARVVRQIAARRRAAASTPQVSEAILVG